MKIKIITGSHRANSSSKAIGEYLANKLSKIAIDASVTCLYEADLPLWHQDKYEDGPKWDNWNNISKELVEADGVIIVAPEYNGAVTPMINNFFLLVDKAETAHKPGLIVGVSSGLNGVYPVSELKAYSTKNNKLTYIPEHLIIRECNEFLENGNEKLEERIEYSLEVFKEYALALKSVRASNILKEPKYKFGM